MEGSISDEIAGTKDRLVGAPAKQAVAIPDGLPDQVRYEADSHAARRADLIVQAGTLIGSVYSSMERKKLTPMGEWAIAPKSFRDRDQPTFNLQLALDGVVVRDEAGRELAKFAQTHAYFGAYDILVPAIQREALRWAKQSMVDQAIELIALEKQVMKQAEALHDGARRVIEAIPGSYSKSPLPFKKGETRTELTARSHRVSMARALPAGQEELLFTLFGHPQGVNMIYTLAESRDRGVTMARAHISASRAAAGEFRKTLDTRKIWRFPPALVAATVQLGVVDIEGTPQFAVALGMLLGRSWWETAFFHAGNALMSLELVGGPIGIAVAEVVDVALAGSQWLLDFFEAADADAAALATDFAPQDERMGERMSAFGQAGSLLGSVGLAAVPFLPSGSKRLKVVLPSKVPDVGDALPIKLRKAPGATTGALRTLKTLKQRQEAARAWLSQLRAIKRPRDFAGPSWDYHNFPEGPGGRWQPGDPIDTPVRNGYPTYDDHGRERYWRNRAYFELQARSEGRAAQRVVKRPGDAGHTAADNLHWDGIESASDDELKIMLDGGKAPDDPMLKHLHPSARKVNIEHERIPQRVAGWLVAVGVSPAEAARLTRASSPDNMMDATRDIHGAFDASAKSKRGGSGVLDAERASSALTAVHKDELEAIIAAVKGRNLAKSLEGRELRHAIEQAIDKFDQLRTPVKERL